MSQAWANACARGGIAGAHEGEPIASHSLPDLSPPPRFIAPLCFLWAILLSCLAAAGCQGTQPSAQWSPTASATSSPVAPTSLVSGDQAYGHVLVLAKDIGSRPAASAAERQAAQYISHQLATYGYETEVEEFSVEYYVEEADLEVAAPISLSLNPSALRLSAAGEVTAELVAAGLGKPEDFPPEGSKGRIALIERGDLSFSDKVANANAAGAAAVVIYNNVEGPFQGDLETQSAIPAVSLSQAEGRQLQTLLEEGPLTAHLFVQATQETGTSQNVIGRPPEDDCQVIVGAHYDSVTAGPGANDNASGSATLLEIARVLDLSDGKQGVCFVAFGSEEAGLFGSRHFVATLISQDEPRPQAMVNLDMVGVGSEWHVVGSASLVEKTDQAAAALGLEPLSTEPHFDSDYLSFMEAGIPAIFIYRFDDPRYHTESDRAEFVEPQLLEEAAKLTLLTLAELAGS